MRNRVDHVGMGEGVRKDVRKGKKRREERESADTEKERHTIAALVLTDQVNSPRCVLV